MPKSTSEARSAVSQPTPGQTSLPASADAAKTDSVSVIATLLNEAEDIDCLIDSLMVQRLAPAEVVIVDGGSTDGTWERLQKAKEKYPRLVAIRDESCRLERCPGPIARGRNVAIAATSSVVVACVDAGCSYEPDWLQNLTAAIRNGDADYALGGSCISLEHSTIWDLAAAPFLGIKLRADAKTKSCTARSMAFRKKLWQRVGGFPEDRFFGEDTMFDMKVRAIAVPAFVDRAKAVYRPHLTFRTAARQLASYALSDGVSGVRPARFLRNAGRCLLHVAAILLLPRTLILLFVAIALEIYFAFHFELGPFRGRASKVVAARLLYSICVPWIVAWNQLKGAITKTSVPNRQNAGP
jgi:glycosyltransferase involved in cell wall biosynthesis